MTAPKKTTIKRGPAKRPTVKPRQKKPVKKRGSMMQALFDALPFSARTIERGITASTVLIIGGTLIAVAVFAGVPGFVGTQLAQAAGRAGFQVKRVEVTGLDRLESQQVYQVALKEHAMAMPLVDLDGIRSELMQYSWISDARVSRRLPDTLVVDVVERKPAAIWQHNQKLSLVDVSGVVLEPVSANAMPDLPLVIGGQANEQVASLTELMEAVPALKSAIAGATWVGNRRWDLRFTSGEVLSLPAGQEFAAKAFAHFARLEGTERLLGRGFARFDMRDPKRMFVRRQGEKPATGPSSTQEGGDNGTTTL